MLLPRQSGNAAWPRSDRQAAQGEHNTFRGYYVEDTEAQLGRKRGIARYKEDLARVFISPSYASGQVLRRAP
jgi:hypothetical protein